MKFPALPGIRMDNLQNTITDALPDNGEWHTLTASVRKVGGVLEVDGILIRHALDEVRVTRGVCRYPFPLQWYRRILVRLIGRSHWKRGPYFANVTPLLHGTGPKAAPTEPHAEDRK